MAALPETPDALRVIVADDEPLARLMLRQRLERCDAPKACVMAEAANAAEVLLALNNQPCDALLLDIRMPGMDGISLARQLSARPQAPSIVFVSAYEEHALEAFEVQAVDYLTKPVTQERLQQALRRVAQQAAFLQKMRAEVNPSGPALVISDRQRTVLVPLDRIVVLRAADKRVAIVTLDEQHFTDESLSELEPRLGPGFVRVHRNAIVALHAVRELRLRVEEAADDGWMLRLMPGNQWVSVSRRQLPLVRAALGGTC